MKVLHRMALDTLAFIVRIYWWGVLVMTPVLIGGAIFFLRGSGKFHVAVPVRFQRGSIKVPGFEYDKVHKLIMTDTGTLSIGFEPTWQNKLIALVLFTASFGAFAVVIYQVNKILKSLMRNDPFDNMNFYRIRVIAYVLIGSFLAEMVFFMVMKNTVFSAPHYQTINIAYTAHAFLLWAGLTMLALEAVFKRGAYLEEEEQLTI